MPSAEADARTASESTLPSAVAEARAAEVAAAAEVMQRKVTQPTGEGKAKAAFTPSAEGSASAFNPSTEGCADAEDTT
jgi:hypothetical protein